MLKVSADILFFLTPYCCQLLGKWEVREKRELESQEGEVYRIASLLGNMCRHNHVKYKIQICGEYNECKRKCKFQSKDGVVHCHHYSFFSFFFTTFYSCSKIPIPTL